MFVRNASRSDWPQKLSLFVFTKRASEKRDHVWREEGSVRGGPPASHLSLGGVIYSRAREVREATKGQQGTLARKPSEGRTRPKGIKRNTRNRNGSPFHTQRFSQFTMPREDLREDTIQQPFPLIFQGFSGPSSPLNALTVFAVTSYRPPVTVDDQLSVRVSCGTPSGRNTTTPRSRITVTSVDEGGACCRR